MTSEPLVVFDRVGKRFGDFVAVEPMSLNINKGEFLAIMGSSGCGKTTTLRMLAGLEAPAEGEIRLAGKRINDLPTWSRDTPVVWQSLALVAEEFVGATAIVHPEGSSGQELRAQKSHDELASLALSPRAKVWMSWDRSAGHLLPGG